MMGERRTMRNVTCRPADGFSLIEVIVATGVLATGLLTLAGVFSIGMVHMAGSTPALIAREKAREAVESVHTARDTGALAWNKIRMVAAGGVFVKDPQPLKKAGPDGLVNTADDANEGYETLPGNDNLFNTADDIALKEYTREIQITDLFVNGSTTVVNQNLRQIKVIVQYRVSGYWQKYTLTTFVSSFS